jgi:hypothetical protein
MALSIQDWKNSPCAELLERNGEKILDLVHSGRFCAGSQVSHAMPPRYLISINSSTVTFFFWTNGMGLIRANHTGCVIGGNGARARGLLHSLFRK